MSLRVSFIICTYNRRKLLGLCLAEFAKQMDQYKDCAEVIVVDNNSSDTTREYVEGLASNCSWLRYVLETRQGLSCARNCGANVSRGEYLCYIDDDGKPGAGYVQRVMELLQRHHPHILGGPVFPYYTTKKPAWFQDRFEIRRSAKVTGYSHSCSISGSNFIILKSQLYALGLFSEQYGMLGSKTRLGEEKAVVLAYRAKVPREQQQVYYSLDLVVYHHVPKFKMRRSYMLRRGFLSGISLVHLKNENLKYIPYIVSRLCRTLFSELIPMLFGSSRGHDRPILAMQRAALQVGKIYELVRVCVFKGSR